MKLQLLRAHYASVVLSLSSSVLGISPEGQNGGNELNEGRGTGFLESL